MALLQTVDPDGMDEFSVVFTDRSLNHMSKAFQQVMLDINGMLRDVYKRVDGDRFTLLGGVDADEEDFR